MKKIISSCIIGLFVFLSFSPFSYAEELITRDQAFRAINEFTKQNVPETYKYIQLLYNDVEKWSLLEGTLQKFVYLDLIPNAAVNISPEKNITIQEFEILAKKVLKTKVELPLTTEEKAQMYMNNFALIQYLELYQASRNGQTINISVDSNIPTTSSGNTFYEKEKILLDVYKTLINGHYDKENLSDDVLIEGAIKWLTNSIWDKYTTYFPPVESENFMQNLDGEYQGIWAYVDMPEPGKLLIVSPMVGSPAEAAGLKGGDQVIQVGENVVWVENSMQEIVSWIKGEKGTTVVLKILRAGEKNPLEFSVVRQTIILKDVEHKVIERGTYYIQIKSFWEKVNTEFAEALVWLKAQKGIKKIIIDLRNNPGGYLDKVSDMLSNFIEKDLPTAIVSQEGKDYPYLSEGYNTVNLDDYEVIILENSGTASASEIMITTLKDYFPDIVIMGEKSFGKGSVQSLKKYFDGSTLKYTTAKWYSGKNRVWIDKIGITPDKEVILDTEKWQKFKTDTQLNAALDY